MDTIAREHRSWVMSRIKGSNTQPEMTVRRLLFSAGYRYRLNDRRLPGSPDLVFSSRKKVIFVHGCFWHRHEGCRLTTTPKTRTEFWGEKFRANVVRDQKAVEALAVLGWSSLTIWQCELKDPATLELRLRDFLGSR